MAIFTANCPGTGNVKRPHQVKIDLGGIYGDTTDNVFFDCQGHFYCGECAEIIASQISSNNDQIMCTADHQHRFLETEISKILETKDIQRNDYFDVVFMSFFSTYQHLSPLFRNATTANNDAVKFIQIKSKQINISDLFKVKARALPDKIPTASSGPSPLKNEELIRDFLDQVTNYEELNSSSLNLNFLSPGSDGRATPRSAHKNLTLRRQRRAASMTPLYPSPFAGAAAQQGSSTTRALSSPSPSNTNNASSALAQLTAQNLGQHDLRSGSGSARSGVSSFDSRASSGQRIPSPVRETVVDNKALTSRRGPASVDSQASSGQKRDNECTFPNCSSSGAPSVNSREGSPSPDTDFADVTKGGFSNPSSFTHVVAPSHGTRGGRSNANYGSTHLAAPPQQQHIDAGWNNPVYGQAANGNNIIDMAPLNLVSGPGASARNSSNDDGSEHHPLIPRNLPQERSRRRRKRLLLLLILLIIIVLLLVLVGYFTHWFGTARRSSDPIVPTTPGPNQLFCAALQDVELVALQWCESWIWTQDHLGSAITPGAASAAAANVTRWVNGVGLRLNDGCPQYGPLFQVEQLGCIGSAEALQADYASMTFVLAFNTLVQLGVIPATVANPDVLQAIYYSVFEALQNPVAPGVTVASLMASIYGYINAGSVGPVPAAVEASIDQIVGFVERSMPGFNERVRRGLPGNMQRALREALAAIGRRMRELGQH